MKLCQNIPELKRASLGEQESQVQWGGGGWWAHHSPVTLICILEILLCCAELYTKVELPFFFSILNHILIQWWGGILHSVGVSRLGWAGGKAPQEGGSCQAWEVSFCPQRHWLVHFHFMLSSEALVLWDEPPDKSTFHQSKLLDVSHSLFSNVLVWTWWRRM